MTSLLSVQDAITTKVNELSQDVYVTAVPDDVKIKHSTTGLFLPYIVILFADVQEAANGQGITSSRNNLGVSFCAIECVAPTERAARQVAELVRDKLVGFTPTGAGEMRIAGGRTYGSVDTDAVPKKYTSEISFRYLINAVV
jgi:hypothetical protein